MEGFWEANLILALFSMFISQSFLKRVPEGQKIEKKPAKTKKTAILGRPGGMCGARGRDREGEIRRSRPRLLKLSNLGLKIFGQDLDLKFSTRLPTCGGAAERSAHSAELASSLVVQQ